MSVILLSSGLSPQVKPRQIEIIALNGKHYIEMEHFENASDLVQLCISLGTEVESLTEKVRTLEEKLLIARNRH